MKQRLRELIELGYSLKVVAKAANVSYMVLHRYYNNKGRELLPEEEAAVNSIYHIYKGVMSNGS